MPSPSAVKGKTFEATTVAYLRRWWPNACRTLAGARDDRGDISGIPLVLELKNHKSLDLAGWWQEAEQERQNARMDFAAIVHKRRGVADPAQQWVTMSMAMLVELLLHGEEA